MDINELSPGIIYKDSHHPEIEYVVLSVDMPMIEVEKVTGREREYSNRCKIYYTCFEFITPIGQMDQIQLQKYIGFDPVINLEKGIYKMLVDLVDINMKELAPRGSVIDLSGIACDKIPASNRYELYMCFRLFGIDGERRATIITGSKEECMDYYWKMMKRIPIK